MKYIDGPFRYLEHHLALRPGADGGSDVHFFIDYEFKSRILGALMGSMFDRAFRMFSDAFEKRADKIYGVPGGLTSRAPQAPSQALSCTDSPRMKARPRSSNSRRSATGSLPGHGKSEPDQADRLVGRAAARPGNAGDGQAQCRRANGPARRPPSQARSRATPRHAHRASLGETPSISILASLE